MAQSSMQKEFRVDYNITPKQQQILTEMATYVNKTVEQFLTGCLKREIEMLVDSPEIFGYLIKQAWAGRIKVAEAKENRPVRYSLELEFPENKLDVASTMRSFIEKYRPSFFQDGLDDNIRAYLEIDEIPEQVRRRLEAEWKKEIGY